MPEEQLNPLDVLAGAESIFPSGPAADQRIDVSSYDDWITAKDIQDPLEGHLGYGDYLREEYVKADAYSGGVEQTIQNEFGSALVQKGLLTEENKDEVSSRIDAYNAPTLEQKVRDMVAHTGLEKDDWHNGVAYLENKDTATPEELAPIIERAEASVANTRNNVVQAKLDGGELAFGRFTDAEGNSFVKAGDLALAMPLHDALRKSQEAGGGVNMTDALSIKSTGLMDVPDGMDVPRYKMIQLSEIESLVQSEIAQNDGLAIQIEAIGKRMAERDYGSFDHFEEGFRKTVGLPVRSFFESVIGGLSGSEPVGTIRERAVDKAMSNDIDHTVMSIARKYNKDPNDVRTVVQEVALRNAPLKVFKKEGEVGNNIRVDGYGLPFVPVAVKLNNELFDAALAERSDITAATKKAMQTERELFVSNNFTNVNDMLANSDLSKDWLEHLNAGRAAKVSDNQILLSFTSNPDNIPFFDPLIGRDLYFRGRDVYRPFTSAFSTVFAMAGADWAKEHLKTIAEDNNRRRELTELFGGKLGFAQDLIKLVPEVTVDIAATALLSKFGGRAVATRAAAAKAPLYSSMTKKGVLKAMTTNAFRHEAGQTTADLAEKLATQNLIRSATSKTALDALEAYNKANLRGVTVSAIGLTAANRSAGATYGTVYNQMLKSGATEEEAHDRAFGTGMVAGTATGLITGTFSAFGRGGMEDALLSGMSYKNMKDVVERIVQRAPDVSLDGVSDAVFQQAIRESGKAMIRKNFFGKSFIRAGAEEFAEEGIDEFVNTFVTDAGLEQDTPFFAHMKHSLYAGSLGGVLGAAAPSVAAAARRIRPDMMREKQQAFALEEDLINNITERLRATNSSVTADVVGDILRKDLDTRPYSGVTTQEDLDAENLAAQDRGEDVVRDAKLLLTALEGTSDEDIRKTVDEVRQQRRQRKYRAAYEASEGEIPYSEKMMGPLVFNEDGTLSDLAGRLDELEAADLFELGIALDDKANLERVIRDDPRILSMSDAEWALYDPTIKRDDPTVLTTGPRRSLKELGTAKKGHRRYPEGEPMEIWGEEVEVTPDMYAQLSALRSRSKVFHYAEGVTFDYLPVEEALKQAIEKSNSARSRSAASALESKSKTATGYRVLQTEGSDVFYRGQFKTRKEAEKFADTLTGATAIEEFQYRIVTKTRKVKRPVQNIVTKFELIRTVAGKPQVRKTVKKKAAKKKAAKTVTRRKTPKRRTRGAQHRNFLLQQSEFFDLDQWPAIEQLSDFAFNLRRWVYHPEKNPKGFLKKGEIEPALEKVFQSLGDESVIELGETLVFWRGTGWEKAKEREEKGLEPEQAGPIELTLDEARENQNRVYREQQVRIKAAQDKGDKKEVKKLQGSWMNKKWGDLTAKEKKIRRQGQSRGDASNRSVGHFIGFGKDEAGNLTLKFVDEHAYEYGVERGIGNFKLNIQREVPIEQVSNFSKKLSEKELNKALEKQAKGKTISESAAEEDVEEEVEVEEEEYAEVEAEEEVAEEEAEEEAAEEEEEILGTFDTEAEAEEAAAKAGVETSIRKKSVPVDDVVEVDEEIEGEEEVVEERELKDGRMLLKEGSRIAPEWGPFIKPTTAPEIKKSTLEFEDPRPVFGPVVPETNEDGSLVLSELHVETLNAILDLNKKFKPYNKDGNPTLNEAEALARHAEELDKRSKKKEAREQTIQQKFESTIRAINDQLERGVIGPDVADLAAGRAMGVRLRALGKINKIKKAQEALQKAQQSGRPTYIYTRSGQLKQARIDGKTGKVTGVGKPIYPVNIAGDVRYITFTKVKGKVVWHEQGQTPLDPAREGANFTKKENFIAFLEGGEDLLFPVKNFKWAGVDTGGVSITQAEQEDLNRIVDNGLPPTGGFSHKGDRTFGVKTSKSRTTDKKKLPFFEAVHEAVVQRIYTLYPVLKVVRPVGGKAIQSPNDMVAFDPWERSLTDVRKLLKGKQPRVNRTAYVEAAPVKHRYRPVAFVDADFEGVFDNDPISMKVLMEENIAVYLPDDFEGRLNPAFRWEKVGGRTKLYDIRGVSSTGDIESVRFRKETTGDINREAFNKRVQFTSKFIRRAGGAQDIAITDPNRSAVGAKTTLRHLMDGLSSIIENALSVGLDEETSPVEVKQDKDYTFELRARQLRGYDKAVEKAQKLLQSADPDTAANAAQKIQAAKRDRESFVSVLRGDVLRVTSRIKGLPEVEVALKKYQDASLKLSVVKKRLANIQPDLDAKFAELTDLNSVLDSIVSEQTEEFAQLKEEFPDKTDEEINKLLKDRLKEEFPDKTDEEIYKLLRSRLVAGELKGYRSKNKAFEKDINTLTSKRDAAFDTLQKIALEREATQKGAETRVTQDPQEAMNKLRRFLKGREGQMALTEANFEEAARQLQAEYANEILFFQLKLSLQNDRFTDDDGNIKAGKIERIIDELLRSVDPVAGVVLNWKGDPIGYEGLKYTPTGKVTKESKREFAEYVLNQQLDNPVKEAGKADNYQNVFRSYIEERIFMKDGVRKRDRMPTYEEIGRRVADRLLKQQALRKSHQKEEGTGFGEGSLQATTADEIAQLGLKDSVMPVFTDMNIERDDIKGLVDTLQDEVIDLLSKSPELEAQLDVLLKSGPFKEAETEVFRTFSVSEKWAELVAYSRLSSQENNPAPIAFVQSLRRTETVVTDPATGEVVQRTSVTGAEILQRAFRLFKLGGFDFGKRDPFVLVREFWKGSRADTQDFLSGAEGQISDGKLLTKENLATLLDDVEQAELYTRWLSDEIQSIANQKGETISDTKKIMRAKNVHALLSKYSSEKSYYSSSQFQNAVDRAVAIDRNNVVAGILGLKTGNNDPTIIIEALRRISAAPDLTENTKMAARILLMRPDLLQKVKFTLVTGSGVNAGSARLTTSGEIQVIVDLAGYNGRGLTDVLLHEYYHAWLLDTFDVDINSTTKPQRDARFQLSQTIRAVREKVGRNASTELTDGLVNLQEFVANIMTNTKFQEYFRGQLEGMTSFKDVIGNLMKVLDPEKAKNKMFRDAFYDVVDLQGYAESKPITPVGQSQEAVNAALNEIEEQDNLYAKFKSATGVDVETVEEVKDLTPEEINNLNAHAKRLRRFVADRMPAEINVKWQPIKGGKVMYFNRSTNTLVFDPKNAALAAHEQGMTMFQSKALISKLIRQEFAHKAAKAALTPEMVQGVMDKSSIADFKRDINNYYGEDTPEAAEALVRLTSGNANVAFKEKERMVQERLAFYVENAIDGVSSAKAEAFFTSNPSLLQTIAFYFKAFINKFIRAFNDGTSQLNAEERIAVSRMLVELRAIQMGYRHPRQGMGQHAEPKEVVRGFLKAAGLEPTEPTEDEDVQLGAPLRLEASQLTRAGTVVPNVIPVELGDTDRAYVEKATGLVTTERHEERWVPTETVDFTEVAEEQRRAELERRNREADAPLRERIPIETFDEHGELIIGPPTFRPVSPPTEEEQKTVKVGHLQLEGDALLKAQQEAEALFEERVSKITVASFRQLAHTVFVQRMGKGSILKGHGEYQLKKDRMYELGWVWPPMMPFPYADPPTDRKHSPEEAIEEQDLKKFFESEDELAQQLFEMWQDHAKVGPTNAEVVVKDDKGNVIPLSERFKFDVNTPTPTPDNEALLKVFAPALGLKTDAKIDEGGILFAGFGTKRRSGDSEFDAFDFNYTEFFEQYDMPVLEVGDFEVFDKGLKGQLRKFIKTHTKGLLQPAIHHWMKHRQSLKKTLGDELGIIHAKLNRLVKEVYPEGVPIDSDGISLIQKATGSTEGAILNDTVQQRLDDEYNADMTAAWETSHNENLNLDPDVKSAEQIEREFEDAIEAAEKKYEAAEKVELDKQRVVIIAERNQALRKISLKSRELFVVLKSLRGVADDFTKKLQQIHQNSERFGKYNVKIDSNLGIYLTRSYKMFLDAGHADAVRRDPKYADKRDAAIDFFERQYRDYRKKELWALHPQKSDAELIQMVNDEITKRKIGHRALEAFISSYETKGGEGYFQAEESVKSMLDNLKRKKNIPVELRDILGEQKDTDTPDNMLRTIFTIGNMAANQAFLNQIAEAGVREGWLITKQQKEDNNDYIGWNPVIDTKSDRNFNPLSGLYGKPELAKAFSETFKRSGTVHANESEGLLANATKYFQILTGLSMAAKTLGAVPGFYLRNALSNILFFGPMQVGYIGSLGLARSYYTTMFGESFLGMDVGRGKFSGRGVQSEFMRGWKGDRAKLDSYISELRELRIVGDESRTNTMRQLMSGERTLDDVVSEFERMMGDDTDAPFDETGFQKVERKTSRAVRAGAKKAWLDKAPRMAAAADSFFKIVMFEHELSILRKAAKAERNPNGEYSSMTEQQIKKAAAAKVLRTTQAYSEAPPLVKAFQRSPIGALIAPFIRFKGDVIRVLWNSPKLAIEEINSDNPVLKKRGRQRMSGSIQTIGLVSYLLPMLCRWIFGVSDDEDEALKAAGPRWARYQNPIYFRIGGELKSLNMTYINPFSPVMDSVSATTGEIFNPDSNPDSVMETVWKSFVVDQYLTEQILAGSIAEAWVGEDEQTGKRVFIEGVDTGTEKAIKQFLHIAKKAYEPRTLEKLRSAYMSGQGDYTELEHSPLGIIGAEFLPTKWRSIDPAQSFKQYIFKSEEARKQIREKFRPLYNKNASVSEKEIHNIYDEVYEDLMHLNKDMIRKMRAFEGLGIPKNELYRLAIGSGGGPKMGKRRTGLLFQGQMEKPVLSTNKVAIMMAEAETDPKMAERLRIFAEATRRYDRFSQIDDD